MEVKWIQLSLGIFDNRKIRQIESLPNGDSIIIIWFKLLCLAGNINDNGLIYFTNEIPYTDQMLSSQFNRPLATVQMALQIFQEFKMIEIIDDIFKVSNWEKYQNEEGLKKIREQTRKRVAKHRENKKLIECNVTCNATVTDCNATDKNKKENKKEKKNISKDIYGEYSHVKLSQAEFDRLVNEYGLENTNEYIKYLDEYIEEKPNYKSQSHNLAIRRWVISAVEEQKARRSKTQSAPQSRLDWIDELREEEQ